MCAPEKMTERTDPASFERFDTGGIVVYVEKTLLSGKSISFSVVSAGDFTLSLSG